MRTGLVTAAAHRILSLPIFLRLRVRRLTEKLQFSPFAEVFLDGNARDTRGDLVNSAVGDAVCADRHEGRCEQSPAIMTGS